MLKRLDNLSFNTMWTHFRDELNKPETMVKNGYMKKGRGASNPQQCGQTWTAMGVVYNIMLKHLTDRAGN